MRLTPLADDVLDGVRALEVLVSVRLPPCRHIVASFPVLSLLLIGGREGQRWNAAVTGGGDRRTGEGHAEVSCERRNSWPDELEFGLKMAEHSGGWEEDKTDGVDEED
jgi:hypothetical protein